MSIQNKIKSLAAENPDIALLWLYGSRVTGAHRQDSDYDLAIAFNNFDLSEANKNLRPHEIALQWQAALGLGENSLSIVDIDRCALYLRFEIINQGCVIHAKDPIRQYQQEAKISALFEHEKLARPENTLRARCK